MPFPTARRQGLQAARAIQQTPYTETPSDVFLADSRPNATGHTLGRLGRQGGIGAPVTGPAAGNWQVTSDARGNTAGFPGRGTGHGNLQGDEPQNASPWPYQPGQQDRPFIRTPPSMLNRQAYAGMAFRNGRGIAHDRHIIENRGTTTSSSNEQATGANPNPEHDGPARPAYRMFNRTLSKMIGVDSTRQLDNEQYHAAIIVDGDSGRKFPLGEQGTEWAKVYGGTRYLADFRPYGSRGRFDPGSPQPTVYADPGGPYRFGTKLMQGDPQDGPQKIYGGLPWGLHSVTVPSQKANQAMLQNRFTQVKPVRQNRPQNNKRSGQSWNQQYVSQSGRQGIKVGVQNGGRQAGLNQRWLGTG